VRAVLWERIFSWCTGARGESSSQQAISTIVESVKQASKRAPMGGLRILIENTQEWNGSGARLEEVGEILAGLRTCRSERALIRRTFLPRATTSRAKAAGFDDWSDRWRDRTRNVPVIHANDSKVPLGGRVDAMSISERKDRCGSVREDSATPRFGTTRPKD